jgi:hypothetical protein
LVQSILENGPTKKSGPNFSPQLDATALVYRSYPEHLFLLYTYACLAHTRQARSQFLSFLDVAKTMARVGRRRNLRSPAEKRRKSGKSGQLLNNFI